MERYMYAGGHDFEIVRNFENIRDNIELFLHDDEIDAISRPMSFCWMETKVHS
jgi:hypothetical protein